MQQASRFRMKGPLLAAGALALVVAACSSGPKATPVATAPAATAIGPMTAAIFMSLASSSALYAVKAAELAEQRSRDADVRALAARQKADAEGISGQLSFAGRRLELLPTASLLPEHQAMIDALAASPDFDKEYVRQQGKMVPDTLRLHRAYAAGGGSPTLRPVAELGATKLADQEKALKKVD